MKNVKSLTNIIIGFILIIGLIPLVNAAGLKINVVGVDTHDTEIYNLLENKLNTEEHITLPTAVRRDLGLREPVNGFINQQIRVGVDKNGNGLIDSNEEYAIYTVVKDYDKLSASSKTIPARMGSLGRKRIDVTSDGLFTVVLDTNIVTSTSCPPIDTIGHFECLFNPNPNQRYLIAIAPHGGSNEIGTVQQVDTMKQYLVNANVPVTTYELLGRKGTDGAGSHERYHITSSDIDNSNLVHNYSYISYPLLSTVARDYKLSMSFHGFALSNDELCPLSDLNENYIPDKKYGHAVVIYVGGLDTQNHKEILRDKIKLKVSAVYNNMDSATKNSYCNPLVKIPIENSKEANLYGGDNPNNIVNWLSNSGLQLEQSTYARYIKNTSPTQKSPFRDPISRAVAEYYGNLYP